MQVARSRLGSWICSLEMENDGIRSIANRAAELHASRVNFPQAAQIESVLRRGGT